MEAKYFPMTDKISNWDLNGIRTHMEYKLNYEADPVTQEIKLITEIMGEVREEIYWTREEHIRNGLIDLGWLPPELAEALRRNLEIAEGFILSHNIINYQQALEAENERRGAL